MQTIPNPDLTVGEGNKQRWNQPAHRRHGFHNAHRIFRRSLTLRAPHQLLLNDEQDTRIADLPAARTLLSRPELSALVCLRGDQVLLSRHAADFPADQPHSIQSITKLFLHLIAGHLLREGVLDLTKPVEAYMSGIESGYRGALLQAVLDMDVENDFSEDYSDPNAACYDEEIALGWRLPKHGQKQMTLEDLVTSIQSADVINHSGQALYKSANSDLLTIIFNQLSNGRLVELTEQIICAAGLEHAFHVSLSAEGLPTFSGGGCMTATDLARFGLLLARQTAVGGAEMIGDADFTKRSVARSTKHLPPPREHVHYSNHLMTNGRWLGHAGYGGQLMLVDPQSQIACVFLSVIENDAGYCVDYMAETFACVENIVSAAAG